MNKDNINNKPNQNLSPSGETEGGRYGAAECGDCNTCGKCDEQLQEEETALFDAAVRAAAAKERNSFEKNLARERKAAEKHFNTGVPQHETFTRNAVARPVTPAWEGAQLNHDGLPLYTLIIYSENFAGILNQITAVFTRRQVNIESLNVCSSSTPGVHKYTITCYCKQEMAEMLTILANQEISRIVRRHDARIVEVNPTYTIVEKTGISSDVLDNFNQLNDLGCVLQFVRSGRIAITRSCIERLDQYIAQRKEEELNA